MQSSNLTARPRSELGRLYRLMMRIADTDVAVQKSLSAGEVAFQYYGCAGQEAIAAGCGAALRESDYLVTTYRGLHDLIAKNTPLTKIVAELFGRASGLSKGKGGAMHLSYPATGLMVTSGIVGGGIPIADGLALAAQQQADGRVTLASFGDGATSIGAFHEALGLAALWDLPVIFLCQNNQYAEYTAVKDYTRVPEFWRRAESYGMTGRRIDGNDPLEVYDAVSEAAARARQHGGPTLIEAVCHRLAGHSFGSDESHMDQGALAEARANSPILRFRTKLLAHKIFSEAELKTIEKEIADEVKQAFLDAKAAPLPEDSEVFTDIFANAGDGEGAPFSKAAAVSGEPPREGTRQKNFVEAVNEALKIALESDRRVILMGEDIADPAGGVVKATAGLSSRFGSDRVRSTPIAEQAIIGAGIGAAVAGMRPVCEVMIMDFFGVCMDQVANHAAKLRYMSGGATSVPMTIRTVMANGLSGFGAQHSQSLEAWFTHVPGLKVVIPSTPFDAKGLLLSAIQDEDPVIFIETARLLWANSHVPDIDYRVPLGKARVVKPGTNATIITYGWTLPESVAAAQALSQEGIEVEIIDLRTLVPLDVETLLESVRRTGRAVVVHSAVEFCGLGAEIAATLHARIPRELKAPVQRVAAAYTPLPYSAKLDRLHYPSRERIIAAVRATLN